MPEYGIQLLKHEDILSFEEITEIIRIAVDMGINKIRLTGGEPLVRKGIVTLVEMIASIEGIEDFALTTNGILLNQYARPLKNAGLKRVNISLDTTNPEKYSFITRGGNINLVYKGIEAAIEAGLNPVKINCVVFHSSNDENAKEVKEFCNKNNIEVRFIRQMNLETGEFSIVEGGNGGNCRECNRLRVTANGMIKPCLFHEKEYSVRKSGVKNALLQALDNKPLNGCFNRINSFYGIGG